MKIGISTASYFTKTYTEQALVPIAQLGAEVCEVFFATHCEYTKKFGRIIKNQLKIARQYSPLQVHSVHALTNQFEPELFSVNDRAYNDAIKVFEKVLAVGKQIGAKHYTFHGATMLKRAVKYSFNYDNIQNKVNILCKLASKYGIKFCYENVHWAYFNCPQYFQDIKDKCPDLGAVLDVKQAMQSEIDYIEYLKVMGDRLRTVHLCDYDSDGNVELPGRGTFDFVTLFKRLNDMNFVGNCLMEVYAKNYKDYGELKQSYLYLLDCYDRSKNN